ncbi:MAG: hypothetical protein RBU37_14900 [Myxococcota bacterium]|jgi:hypothetical protein|nr:hypothetical protein [Myxococcota bacterium]
MIRPLSLNQELFRVPTLRIDARGLATGERGVLRFAILPHVVAFFQSYSHKHSLDTMAQSLRILKIRSRTHGLEFIVDLPVQGSYQLDAAAQIARILRGEVFTGSWPHFVPYRDRQSPIGYDAEQLVKWDEGPVFYHRHAADKFSLDGEIAFNSLLFDLALLRSKPSEHARCMLKLPMGLRAPMQALLWRRKLSASIAQVVREPKGKFDQAESFYLFDVQNPPRSFYGMLQEMPGVEVYHAVNPSIYVERGYTHPFALESCVRFLEGDTIHFFSGSRNAVDRCDASQLAFVDIEHARAQAFRLSSEPRTQQLAPIESADEQLLGRPLSEALQLQVSLVAVQSPHFEPATAAWINHPRELEWLKRLIFGLPQQALDEYRIALTRQGVMITHKTQLEWVPLGMQLRLLAPNVYAPLGYILSPRLSPAQLATALAQQPKQVYVLPGTIAEHFAIPESAFVPLARRVLAGLRTNAAEVLGVDAADMPDVVEYQSVPAGRFALWRQNLLRPSLSTTRTKALPSEPS